MHSFRFDHKIVIFLICLIINSILSQNTGQRFRKVRRPNRLDHVMCRQKHNGLGIRSSAVLNRNGELCKTYCRVINRVNNSATFATYNSPNNLRCGPRRARCIEGICQVSDGNPVDSGVINTIDDSKGRRNRPRVSLPDNGIAVGPNRRIRPGRRNRQKTTSLSTLEITEVSETSTPDFVIKENSNDNNAKIIFPDN